jgi:hypothetical protein
MPVQTRKAAHNRHFIAYLAYLICFEATALTTTSIRCLVVSQSSKLAGYVFISYVHEDSHRVDSLQLAMETAGVPVWRDRTDLRPGDNWQTAIREAITNNAQVFLACFSRNSEARYKSYQNEELRLAMKQLRLLPVGRTWLIPVLFDRVDIPDGVREFQCADLSDPDCPESTAKLIEAVRRILGPTTDNTTNPAEVPTWSAACQPRGSGSKPRRWPARRRVLAASAALIAVPAVTVSLAIALSGGRRRLSEG